MLVEFSVKNFMSIKDERTFSMLAGSGDENIENIVNDKRLEDDIIDAVDKINDIKDRI